MHVRFHHRWFCCLGLDDKVPDHSTFSRYRHGKFRESELLRQVFEAEDFGEALTPELREQEERLRAEVAARS